MLILLALFGCGNVSNEIFAEDGDFFAAFPDEDSQSVGFDEDTRSATARAEIGDRAELVELSVAIGAEVNGGISELLGAVEAVQDLPPSERTDDGRRWGPYSWNCDVDISARMARDGGVYEWSFSGHKAGEDEVTLLYGTHYAGETVARGDGNFSWDHTQYAEWCGLDEAGLLSVGYDNREGVALTVEIEGYSRDGSAPVDRQYAYARTTELGDFQYRTEADLEWDDSAEFATVEVRDRWVPGSGGRSDAVVSGGGLGGETLEWSQCWDSAGNLVYEVDNLVLAGERGDAGACLFDDVGSVGAI